MSRYLLDTNIISNVIKPSPSEALLAWMREQADEDLFIAASDNHAERVRMAMAGRPRSKRTSIDDYVDPAISQHREARVGEER